MRCGDIGPRSGVAESGIEKRSGLGNRLWVRCMQFLAWLPFRVAMTPIQTKSSFLTKPAKLSRGRAKNLQSQMQSQPQNNTDPTLYLTENNGEPGGARTRDHRIKSAQRLRPPAVLFPKHGLQDQARCSGLHRVTSNRCQTWYQPKRA
jgi:hypothetical protein